MADKQNYNELDDLFSAYILSEFSSSEDYELLATEFNDFFKRLLAKKVISKSQEVDLCDKLGDITDAARYEAFRFGFAKGLSIRNDVVNLLNTENESSVQADNGTITISGQFENLIEMLQTMTTDELQCLLNFIKALKKSRA